MKDEYLDTVRAAMRLVAGARTDLERETASLMVLALLAKLDRRWRALKRPAGLPSPKQVRALLELAAFRPVQTSSLSATFHQESVGSAGLALA
jgi:hypothetical protein